MQIVGEAQESFIHILRVIGELNTNNGEANGGKNNY